MDLDRLRAAIEKAGPENVSFVRMEATTNLIGGQPFSLENLRQVKALIEPLGIFLVVDGSLISENAYFIRQREPGYENTSIRDIIREMMSIADLCYLSGRKSCSVRGGMIATNRKDLFEAIRPWLPVYEGFFTYGGMSSKEIEAMAVGIREMTELDVAGASADAIKYFVCLLQAQGQSRSSRLRAGWPATWTRCASSITCRNPSTRPARWRRRSTSPRASAAWSAARSRWIAMRKATTCPPTWNCCGWPCRGASTRCRIYQYAADRLKWLLRPPQADRRPGVLRRAAGAALLRRQDEAEGRRLGRRAGRGVREKLRPGVLAGFGPDTSRRFRPTSPYFLVSTER